MTSLVRTQILAVRDTGETNMFAINAVQSIAFDYEFYELVTYLDSKDSQREYWDFIIYGDDAVTIVDDEETDDSSADSNPAGVQND